MNILCNNCEIMLNKLSRKYHNRNNYNYYRVEIFCIKVFKKYWSQENVQKMT